MNFLREHKKVAIGIALVIVGFVFYGFFTGDTEEGVVTVSDATEQGALVGAIDPDLLVLLTELPNLKLDSSVFESAAFKGLIDFGQEIVAQPIGRPNPFAPIGVDAGSGTITEDDAEESSDGDDDDADAETEE